MLKIDNISVSYGQVKALLGVSIEVNDGEIVSIIGSNGAGKSSLMRSIVVYVPEGRQVFAKLSVLENLEMGAFSKPYSRAELQEHYDEMFELFPILKKKRSQLAGSLSGGQQQMLALCRGLMCDPKIILLDEPSLGLAPVIVDEVFDKIREINEKKGISILLVEQNAYMALEASLRCYVLENGVVKLSGNSTDLAENESVKAAYLGG